MFYIQNLCWTDARGRRELHKSNAIAHTFSSESQVCAIFPLNRPRAIWLNSLFVRPLVPHTPIHWLENEQNNTEVDNIFIKNLLNWKTAKRISKIKVCANFSRFLAEMDARADVKHEISFNRPYWNAVNSVATDFFILRTIFTSTSFESTNLTE